MECVTCLSCSKNMQCLYCVMLSRLRSIGGAEKMYWALWKTGLNMTYKLSFPFCIIFKILFFSLFHTYIHIFLFKQERNSTILVKNMCTRHANCSHVNRINNLTCILDNLGGGIQNALPKAPLRSPLGFHVRKGWSWLRKDR